MLSGLAGLLLGILKSLVLCLVIFSSAVLIGRVVDSFDDFLLNKISGASGCKIACFAINRLMFPGVIIHELAHAVMAWATGARVTKIRCLTLFSKDVLGYVNFVPTGKPSRQAVQNCLISCAPVLSGLFLVPACVFGILSPTSGPIAMILYAWLGLSILCHARMSRQDMDIYLKALPRAVWLVLPICFVAQALFLK